MCYALRLHMSAAPPRVGLTQALGLIRRGVFEMPEVQFGPKLDIDFTTWQVTTLPGVILEANTIGELFEAYEEATGAYVVPHDPPKYFRYYETRKSQDCVLVDVHVHRGELNICIKQDLFFPVFPDDKIVIGCLGC